MIINLLAAILFWVIPYLTGRIFTRGIVYSFAAGCLFWFLTFFLVSWVVSFFQISHFSTIIFALVIITSLIAIVKILKQNQTARLTDKMPLLALAILASVVYFFIWHLQTPYPLPLNWDIYEHFTLANKISYGQLSLFSSKLSDTFTINSYPPLFHIILSIPHILLKADFLGTYFFLEYFYFLLTVVATFLLARKIFQNTWVAFTAGIFSVFIFENFMVYTALFLMPQNLAALLTVLALTYIPKEGISKLNLTALLLAIFLIHYIIGALAILLILLFIFFRKYSFKLLDWGIFVSTTALLLLMGINYLGSFVLTGREEALHFTFPLKEKFSFLLDWFSLSFLLLPLGYFAILKNGNREQKVILILALLTLGISLAPWSYFLKFFVFDHYLLSLLLATGFGTLILNLPRPIKIAASLWIGLSLLIVFFESQLAYKTPLLFEGRYSHLSPSEITTARLISKNYGQDTMLISDPGTQYILESLSGINSPGGVYMNAQNRQTLSQLRDETNIPTIKAALANIADELPSENSKRKRTVWVLSGRYFAWLKLPPDQKLSSYYNIWRPYLLSSSDLQYIHSLTFDQGLKIVYQNDELFVIEIL